MDRFRFSLPTTVIAERGAVRNHAADWNLGRKALIVTGAQSAKASGALDDVIAALESQQTPYVIDDGIRANPDDAQVYDGAEIARREGCDFVVAVGGGSPMDAGKAIAWVAGTGIEREAFFGRLPGPSDRVLPIVAVPLTCGTGSEVTPYAIITNHKIQSKTNISGSALFPRVALLDAAYLEKLPQAVLCDTALDALSHAIESVYSLRSTKASCMLAFEAMSVIVPELLRMTHGMFVNRAALHYASMVAGMAIAQTGTALVHAMGYPLTYHKGMPHGRANGLLLPGYLTFMTEHCPELTKRVLAAMGMESPDALQALVDALIDGLGLPRASLTEDELRAFSLTPLRLEMMRRYRAMPTPAEVIDIYRNGL